MKKVFLLFAAATMLAVIAVCIWMQNNDAINSVRIIVKAEDGVSQAISLYYDNGIYYAFLPSHTDPNTMEIRSNGDRLYLDGQKINSRNAFSDIVFDQIYTFEIKNLFGESVREQLVFMKGEHIPAMFITLTDGTINDVNADKNVSSSGYVTIINTDQTIGFSGMLKDLHSRGNTSWWQAKKPYTLRFAQPVELLGMDAGTGWVLISNSFDESELRNKLAYDTAKALDVEYAVDSEYVDLYIDQEYFGLYLLSEKPEVEENRVGIRDLSVLTQEVNYVPLSEYDRFEETDGNKIKKGFLIPNDPDDITGGYLFQAEHHADQIAMEENMFQTDMLSFTVSHPGYASKNQIDYISALVNRTENALKAGDVSGVDLESFAKYYLVQELFANSDESSAYIYKDSGDDTLHACCIWDLDLSIGSSWYYPELPPDVLYQSTYNWFPYLYQNKDFRSILADLYQQYVRADPDGLLYQKLEAYKELIDASFCMNKLRWKKYDVEDAETSRSQLRFQTLDEHVDYIRDYMEKRIGFLDSAWIEGVEYRTVSFITYENITFKRWYSLRKGELLDDSLVPEISAPDSARFAGWFDEDGNRLQTGAVVSQNKNYTAKWESTASEAP